MRAPWCTVPIRCAGSRVRLPKDSAVRKIMCNIYSSCSILLLATSNHLLLRVGACLHGFAFLEMQRDIDTYLERVSQLAERELRARSLALHGKGVVFGVGKVAYPKINVHWPEVGIGMCT